jgi:hypothetical protein
MKKFLSVLILASALASAHAADFAGTFKMNNKAKTNSPATWCSDGFKVEVGNSYGKCVVADAYYDMVIVKSGTKDDVWLNVVPGDRLCTTDGKGVSHIIYCPGEPPVEETCPPGFNGATDPSPGQGWFINEEGCWEEAV